MSVNPKYLNIIKTPVDNNCLFRSIVIFLNENLLSCRRNKCGKPVNKLSDDYEGNCTKFLRETVVRMIKSRKHKYEAKEFFDNENYSSIDDRISKMSHEGEFGGKLEMDIIAKMYKINITVFIEFNGEYSSIYKTSSEPVEELEERIAFKNVLESEIDEYNYSKSNTCFLLLDNNHYNLLEPEYNKIKQDYPQEVIELVISEEESDNSLSEETSSLKQPQENVHISISEKKLLSLTRNISNSDISESSLLNSSNASGRSSIMFEDGFEKIELNKNNKIKNSNEKYHNKLDTYLDNTKNALLIHSDSGSKFLELKENYKDICFNDLTDIISSIEEWSNN